MPNFKCNNEKCKRNGEIQFVSKVSISIVNGESFCKQQICECGIKMENIKTDGFPTAVHGSQNACNA